MIAAGRPLNAGGVRSWTVTTNDAVATLRCVSSAVHVTVVAPNGKVEPEAGVHVVAFTGSSGSVAVTAKEMGAPEGPVASAIGPAGTASVGAVESERTSASATIFAA